MERLVRLDRRIPCHGQVICAVVTPAANVTVPDFAM